MPITIVLILLEAFKVIHIGWFLCFLPVLLHFGIIALLFFLPFIAAFLTSR